MHLRVTAHFTAQNERSKISDVSNRTKKYGMATGGKKIHAQKRGKSCFCKEDTRVVSRRRCTTRPNGDATYEIEPVKNLSRCTGSRNESNHERVPGSGVKAAFSNMDLAARGPEEGWFEDLQGDLLWIVCDETVYRHKSRGTKKSSTPLRRQALTITRKSRNVFADIECDSGRRNGSFRRGRL